MLRGAFLLLAVTALLACCGVVSAAANADLVVSKATSSDLASATYRLSENKGVRSLRTSETDKDLADEERGGNNFYADMSTWLSSLSKQVTTKAETSPKVLKWFSRSNSIKKLAETKSLTLEALQRSLVEKYAVLEKTLKNPDDLFTMMKLNPEVAAMKNFDHKVLRKVSDEDWKTYGQYYLWHGYSEYYKGLHPNWVSGLGKA